MPSSDNNVINIGSRLELFVDDFLIDRLEKAEFRLHHPVVRENVFQFDAPWEGRESCYVSIFNDGNQYRMYYRGSPCSEGASPEAKGWGGFETTCIALSDDGIHWTRPNVGLFSFAGAKENNIVWMGEGSHCFFAFKDTNPEAKPEETYKAFAALKPTPFFWTSGLFPLASPDGFTWKLLQNRPGIIKGGFDSQNVVFWDQEQNQYVSYLRDAPEGVRGITRSVSADFLQWSDPEPLKFPGMPKEALYTNAIIPYFRAPHLYLGFPMRFWDDPKPVPSHPNPGISDGVFMSSRDGVTFHRWVEAFFRPGLDLKNWTDRNNMAARGLFELQPGEISLYYSQHYQHPTNHLVRATIRTDGFVSLQAGAGEAEILTKPLMFSGKELVLNFSTSTIGFLRVELQDIHGRLLVPGIQLENCRPIFGDELDRMVRWKFGSDLSSFAYQPVRLRFRLKDADLYSMLFRP